jgi:hypothetical protein
MAMRSRFATIIVGTTSILSLQLFGVLNRAQANSLQPFRNLASLQPVVATSPANTSSTNLIISQATRSRLRFIPPVVKNPRSSQGSGSRGCEASLPGDMVTLLIPSTDYVGQTTSGHPTFFWHLSQSSSVPIKFTLVEPGVAQPLFEKQIDSSKPGIIQLELPKDRPELVTGRTYGWSVTLVCNARRPSANPYFYSWIERVPTTRALEQQLAEIAANSNSQTATPSSENHSSDRQRASIYAQAGLWYDALAIISKAQAANPQEPSIQNDFLSLLDQVGLRAVVEQQHQLSQNPSRS